MTGFKVFRAASLTMLLWPVRAIEPLRLLLSRRCALTPELAPWGSIALFSRVTRSNNGVDGKVFTWGSGEHGKLGHNDCEMRALPTLVGCLSGEIISEVLCGAEHVMAINGAFV